MSTESVMITTPRLVLDTNVVMDLFHFKAPPLKALAEAITNVLNSHTNVPEKKLYLLAEKCWQLIQSARMKGISRKKLKDELEQAAASDTFNLYAFSKQFFDK